MDSNRSPDASLVAVAQPSLTDLLAGARYYSESGGRPTRSASTTTAGLTGTTNTPTGIRRGPPATFSSASFAARTTRGSSRANTMSVTQPRHGHLREDDGTTTITRNPRTSSPRRSQRLATTVSTSSTAHASESSPAVVDAASRKRRFSRASTAAPTTSTTTHIRPTLRSKAKPPPAQLKQDPDAVVEEDDRKPAAKEAGAPPEATCCICMCPPEPAEEATISGCDHVFCFDCIGKWADRENTCPLCKTRFTSINRVHKVKRQKGKKRIPNSKKVRARDQRADLLSGPAIEAMLASIAAAGGPGGNSRIGRFFLALSAGPRRGPPSIPPFASAAAAGSTSAAASSSAAGGPPRARARFAARSLVVDEDDALDMVFAADEDDDDDGDLPMIDFGRLFSRAATATAASRQAGGSSSRFAGFAAASSSAGRAQRSSHYNDLLRAAHRSVGSGVFLPPPPAHSRTFATNSSDQGAGTSAANPLEIDLDDEDDDSVEILSSLP